MCENVGDTTGLSGGVLMLAATQREQPRLRDATVLRGGVSRSLLTTARQVSKIREPPRDKPVASSKDFGGHSL